MVNWLSLDNSFVYILVCVSVSVTSLASWLRVRRHHRPPFRLAFICSVIAALIMLPVVYGANHFLSRLSPEEELAASMPVFAPSFIISATTISIIPSLLVVWFCRKMVNVDR